MKWANSEENVIRSADDFPHPSTLGQKIGVAAFVAFVLLAPLAWFALPAEAHHAQPDVLGAVYAAAQRYGVPAEPLVELVRCESKADAHAEGDYRWRDQRFVPTSRGPAQINDLPTGLASFFWSLGYDDRTDPEQVADFIARVAAGQFLPGQPDAPPLHPTGIVSLSRWSCARHLGIA